MVRPSSLKPSPGGPVPLFDRLSDDQPLKQREAVSLRVLDRDGVLASVERELARLFNTRSDLPMSRWADHEHTVVHYGLPDYMHLSPRNGGDRERMARIIEQAIAAYEPRLRNVQLTPLAHDDREIRSFRFKLDGDLVIGSVIEPVSFPIVL